MVCIKNILSIQFLLRYSEKIENIQAKYFTAKHILKIISFPITFLTFGLFSLVINVGLVYLVEAYIDGFHVSGFVAPLIFSFIVGMTNSLVGMFTK